MEYIEDYKHLKKIFNQNEDCINIPSSDIIIETYKFTSPDNPLHNYETTNDESLGTYFKNTISSQIARADDSEIQENISFRYSIFKNKTYANGDVIILLHGLNERNWNKYLPWAKRLVELTGKQVILFPISFHMDRAPELWSNPRIMNKICKERAEKYSKDNNSSFINAAISTRLQFRPQRFFRSGLKTIYDILHLISEIRKGEQEGINRNAKINLFGYSIGAFISEILFISNPSNIFDESRLFIFCGGPAFEKMRPVSKYIIDRQAYSALRKYYIEDFDDNIKSDCRLSWFFRETNIIAKAFMSMLDLNKLKTFRETRLKELSSKIVSLSLVKDIVMPFSSVKETLCSISGNNCISADFPYEYDHVNPFPVIERISDSVNRSFEKVFKLAASSLM
jgi:hypothetical protein